jgi:hypothetical protein
MGAATGVERADAEPTLVPVHTDARGYVRAIADGRFDEAYLIARGPNPFASMRGRICGAPCEAACRRGRASRVVMRCPADAIAMERLCFTISPSCGPEREFVLVVAPHDGLAARSAARQRCLNRSRAQQRDIKGGPLTGWRAS